MLGLAAHVRAEEVKMARLGPRKETLNAMSSVKKVS